MKVSELVSVLNNNPYSQIAVTLPDGEIIPAHFHITEIGKIQKDFIDCGGTTRSTTFCSMQVWVAGDKEHRLNAEKLIKIITLAESVLQSSDLPIEVEYEKDFITQYPLLSAESNTDVIVLRLGKKHTACLALDRCGIEVLPVNQCSNSGCC